MVECFDIVYVEFGIELCVKGNKGRCLFGEVVDVFFKEFFVRFRVGDLLVIIREGFFDEFFVIVLGVYRLICFLGYLFDLVKLGEIIGFDDGKIWGIIKGVSFVEVIVFIIYVGFKGMKLGLEKFINIF